MPWLHPTPGMAGFNMCPGSIRHAVWGKPNCALGYSNTPFGCTHVPSWARPCHGTGASIAALGLTRVQVRRHAYPDLDGRIPRVGCTIHDHGCVQAHGWINASLATDAPLPCDGCPYTEGRTLSSARSTHPRHGTRGVNPCVDLAHDRRWMHSWPGTGPSVPWKGCLQGPT